MRGSRSQGSNLWCPVTNSFYRAFEDRYRGSRELIKSRLRPYLPFIEPLQALYQPCTAVDLGCGRGEWLELMGEIGIEAVGVDLDEGMLAACRERGLNTEAADAIAYLQRVQDANVAVVSGFHFVEHISFDSLQTLAQEALRVLKPGGLLILETPNPENLVVATTNFYLDPTHQKPIPPLLLSFVAEHYGFNKVKIVRLQEPIETAQLQSPTLLDVLNGASMDYAIVAQKPTDFIELPFSLDAAFQKEYGVDLRALAVRYDQQMSGKLEEVLLRVDRAAEFEARARAAINELAAVREATAAERSSLSAQLERAYSEVHRLDSALGAITDERDQARSALRSLESELKAVGEERDQARSEAEVRVASVTTQLDAVLTSTSWRLTAPLRGLKRIVSRSLSRN